MPQARIWTFEELQDLINQITIKREASYAYEIRKFHPDGSNITRFALVLRKWRQDTDTGEMGWGEGGEYLLPLKVSASAIIQKCMKMLIDYDEHEDREDFEFLGVKILGPHPQLVLESNWDTPRPPLRMQRLEDL